MSGVYKLMRANPCARSISTYSISAFHFVIIYLHLLFDSKTKNYGNYRLQRNSAICIAKMSRCICLYKAYT